LCKCDECKNNEHTKPCTFEHMFVVQKEIRKKEIELSITKEDK